MPGQVFVLNEWVLHDLDGENGLEAQWVALRILQRIKSNRDEIAVLQGTPWMRKAFTLMTRTDVPRRQLSKYLHLEIIRDSQVCRLLPRSNLPSIPTNLEKCTPPADLYLVETYLASSATMLITADQELICALEGTQVAVRSKEDFVAEYLKPA